MKRLRARLAMAGALAGAALIIAAVPGIGTGAQALHRPAVHTAFPVFHPRARKTNPNPFQPPPVFSPINVSSPGLVPTPTDMTYFGGTVLVHPQVYLVFWGWHGQDPDGVRAILIQFFRDIGGTAYENVVTQYSQSVAGKTVRITNPAHQLAGVWDDDTSTIHDGLTTAEFADETVRAIRHFNPAHPLIADPNATYLIATPADYNDAGFEQGGSGGYCAYHETTSDFGVTPRASFIVLPYVLNKGQNCGEDFVNPHGTLDGVTIVSGHEYLEAITDPIIGTGWFDIFGNENGDKCAWVTIGPGAVSDQTLNGHVYAVQGTWSNQADFDTGNCATQ